MTPVSHTQWYLVTNHLNLSFMLASGLMLPRSGFAKKYYKDPLQFFPGYLPLFCDPVPSDAIEMATQEARHLIPVMASVNLTSFKGPIAAIDAQGRLIRDLVFPEHLSGQEVALLIPAPLPVSLIDTLHFETQAAVKKFKTDIQAYNNVAIEHISMKPLKKIFKQTRKESDSLIGTSWYNAGDLNRNVPLDQAFCAGGILGLAFHAADKNSARIRTFDYAFNARHPQSENNGKPEFTDRPLSWLVRGAKLPEDHTLTEKMFWGMAAALGDKTTLPNANARDRAMDFLENQCVQWPAVASNDRLKASLERLTKDLEGLDRATLIFSRSELFDRHEKPFARAAILFFLHRDSPGMIDSNHEALNPEDLFAANLLVCAHRGWIGLPLEMKRGAVLQAAVTHRMAALSHTLAGTGVSFGPAPEPPMPFPALFEKNETDGQWRAEQKKAALALAKAQKWDCISTTISLGNGDYTLKSTTGGVAIILDGLEKGISHDIHQEKFYKALSEAEIPEKADLEVRKILGHPR